MSRNDPRLAIAHQGRVEVSIPWFYDSKIFEMHCVRQVFFYREHVVQFLLRRITFRPFHQLVCNRILHGTRPKTVGVPLCPTVRFLLQLSTQVMHCSSFVRGRACHLFLKCIISILDITAQYLILQSVDWRIVIATSMPYEKGIDPVFLFCNLQTLSKAFLRPMDCLLIALSMMRLQDEIARLHKGHQATATVMLCKFLPSGICRFPGNATTPGVCPILLETIASHDAIIFIADKPN